MITINAGARNGLILLDNHRNMQSIPDDSSIFTAEAKAIDLALDFISTCDANN